jgi:hypothetical protein
MTPREKKFIKAQMAIAGFFVTTAAESSSCMERTKTQAVKSPKLSLAISCRRASSALTYDGGYWTIETSGAIRSGIRRITMAEKFDPAPFDKNAADQTAAKADREMHKKLKDGLVGSFPASDEGTRLGLSMAHDIVVKQHGGRIEVQTEPGAYTEFIIHAAPVCQQCHRSEADEACGSGYVRSDRGRETCPGPVVTSVNVTRSTKRSGEKSLLERQK